MTNREPPLLFTLRDADPVSCVAAARTLSYYRDGFDDADCDDVASFWWRKADPFNRAAKAHARSIKEAKNETDRCAVLLAHDIVGCGQAKLYGRVPWNWLLSRALRCYLSRAASVTGRCGVANIPSPSDEHALTARSAPDACGHIVRASDEDPVYALLLDFDFDALASAEENAIAWHHVRSPDGPVARAARLIEKSWRRKYPNCAAHILLFETRSDDIRDPGKPSVHGYLFETLPGLQTDGDFLHVELAADPWYRERGIDVTRFLDVVAGHTARAPGMAKSEAHRDPINYRYMRVHEPMEISDPFARRVYLSHKQFAVGRMLNLFTDTPIPTFRWREQRLHHFLDVEEVLRCALTRSAIFSRLALHDSRKTSKLDPTTPVADDEVKIDGKR
eukprot:gene29207-36329_t